MIFTEPFILVSEIFQHVVIIVLVGYLVVELLVGHGKCNEVTCKPHFCPVFGDGRKEIILLLTTTVVVGAMIIGEYFYVPVTALAQIVFHAPSILVIVYTLSHFFSVRHNSEIIHRHRSLLFLNMGLLVLLCFEMLVGVYQSVQLLWWRGLLESVIKTIEVLIIYFFTMRHITNDDKCHEKF